MRVIQDRPHEGEEAQVLEEVVRAARVMGEHHGGGAEERQTLVLALPLLAARG